MLLSLCLSHTDFPGHEVLLRKKKKINWKYFFGDVCWAGTIYRMLKFPYMRDSRVQISISSRFKSSNFHIFWIQGFKSVKFPYNSTQDNKFKSTGLELAIMMLAMDDAIKTLLSDHHSHTAPPYLSQGHVWLARSGEAYHPPP